MGGILLATHGGPSADGATRVASLLAGRLQLPLRVLVVYEPMPVADYGYGITYVATPEDDDAVRAALVASAREQFRRCGLPEPAPEVRTGLVVSEIVAAASEGGARLIVTGLGSHSIVDRTLGGETALQLAQDASAPILAVPGQATAIPHRVLSAIDFSATSLRAAQVAATWLRSSDELRLVYVGVEPRAAAHSTPTPPQQPLRERLMQIGAELATDPGIRVDVAEVAGDPARALVEQARRMDADVITLGSHGYGAVKRLILGSVASKIIRVTMHAVLVAPIGCVTA
jgi:nucleotide-binding universal stress UspA family protein